jgi:hypothetical protein
MERVAFLLEETNETLPCLLNPDTLVMRRLAGVRPRRSAGGGLTGTGLADDPLLYTGGGRTELEMDLLFDINLAGASITTDDVRDLTGPLWNLAENAASKDGYGQPPLVRFVWGKAWNVPGVITAVAERLEQFSATGAAQRSWLRLRLLRVREPGTTDTPTPISNPEDLLEMLPPPPEGQPELPPDAGSGDLFHEIQGGGEGEEAGTGERLDLLAFTYFGRADAWRLLAVYNDLIDPLRLAAGTVLRIPPVAGQLELT